MSSKRKNCVICLALMSVLFVLIDISSIISNVKAQGASAAVFTNSEHSPKVYEGTSDKWNLTIMNKECSVDIFSRAWFFFKFYINDQLTFDEFQSSGNWELNKGSSTTKGYNVPLGNGPAVETVKIELYWDQGAAGQYLQDTSSFDVTIVKLYIDAWSPSSLSVEQGGTASSLSITFKNGGNDYMYTAKISVVDTAGLQIDPQSQNLEDIASGGSKTTSFSVTAPNTLVTGEKTVSFKIDYNDFIGVTHSETKAAAITVNESSILGLRRDYIIFITAGIIIIVAITVAYLFFSRRKKKQIG